MRLMGMGESAVQRHTIKWSTSEGGFDEFFHGDFTGKLLPLLCRHTRMSPVFG